MLLYAAVFQLNETKTSTETISRSCKLFHKYSTAVNCKIDFSV